MSQSESMSATMPSTWEDYSTTILPPLSSSFTKLLKESKKKTTTSASTAESPWSVQEPPSPELTPKFVRVDPTIPTRLLAALRRGLKSNGLLSQPITPEANRKLERSLDGKKWSVQDLKTEGGLKGCFTLISGPVTPLVSKVYTTFKQQSKALRNQPSNRKYSQEGSGTLFAFAKPIKCERGTPYRELPVVSLEFKTLKVLLRYAKKLVQNRPLCVTGKAIEHHEAILLKHALQLLASETPYGLISAGFCGCYTELVKIPHSDGSALLISPLFNFTSTPIPPELAPDWTSEEIQDIALSPVFAVVAGMSCARISGFQVQPTGLEMIMPEPTDSDRELERQDETSGDDADIDDHAEPEQEHEDENDGNDHDHGDDDDDEKSAAGKKRQRKQQEGDRKRRGGPGDKGGKFAPSRKSRVKGRIEEHLLGMERTEHQMTISFSEPSHSSAPVEYHRLRFVASPSDSRSNTPAAEDQGPSTGPTSTSAPQAKDISEPIYEPRDAISHVVLSQNILASDNSSAWRGTAKLVHATESIPVVVKFVQGRALSMAKCEIEIYETAYVKDVMPCYYGTWMLKGAAGVAILIEDVGDSLKSSCKDISPRKSKKIISALRKLHVNGINHGDFRARNVGRWTDGKICIFDYGCATRHECPGKQCPELEKGLRYFCY